LRLGLIDLHGREGWALFKEGSCRIHAASLSASQSK
jgi:hypothetical protein